jgi:O-antigen/teichoic acid export membrane protein
MRTLWRDGAVYALGTIVSRGLGLLLLPLYTRALAPQQFGVLDLIVTAGVLVNLLVPLETPQAVARLWNERADGDPRRRLAVTGLVFAAICYAVFVALAWLFADAIAPALGGGPQRSSAVKAGAAFIAANGLMLVLQGHFRWALQPRAYAVSGGAYSLLVLGGLAALLAGSGVSVSEVLWLQCAAATAVALGCVWSQRWQLGWRIDSADLLAMLRFSLPLVPAGVAVFATLNLHRFVLNTLGSLEDVGLFAVASRLAGVATLVLLGVQSALTPLIYAHHAEPETPARLARLFEGFWVIALLVCLLLGLLGRELLALLATPDYANAAPLMLWLAPAALLAQMYIFAPGIPLAKKTHWQLALTVTSAALGLLLSWWWVPAWGALGAAAATCMAVTAFFGTWLAAGQRLYRLPLRWRPLALASLAYICLAAAAMWAVQLPSSASAWAAKAGIVVVMLAALLFTGLLHPLRWQRSRSRGKA